MRTMSRGRTYRRALRLGLVSATAILVAACSSDANRLSVFGVDQAQPAAQPVYAQQPQTTPVFQQAPQIATQPQALPGTQPVPMAQPTAGALTAPAPYTAPTFVAPGYPQTTASVSQPVQMRQPAVQPLPQPVAQPLPAPQRMPQQVAQPRVYTPPAPTASPNARLARTPNGLVGTQMPVAQASVAQMSVTQMPVAQLPARPQPIQTQPLTTASIPTAAPAQLPAQMSTQVPAQASRQAGWSAIGGTRVQVQNGETLYSMSRRYGIPVDVLQRVNNLSDPNALRFGQQIIIPVYSTASAGTPIAQSGVDTVVTGSTGSALTTPATAAVPAPAPRPATAARAPQAAPAAAQAVPAAGTHVVASGETLYSIARRYGVPPQQLIAANALANPNAIRIGQRLVVSGSGQAAPAVAQSPASTQTPAQVVASRSYTPPQPASTPAAVQQTAAIQQVAARNDAIAEQTPLQFRWPIRGRVLSTFGTQSNGARNDGVNIAVPEGASVRAAEEGEVVYAGSELRGFGNLVLVQHRGGYVTAYAHNSRLEVQRGDRVSRGEIIARAGSTGDVDTPQLHFEIRRGTTPVDPAPYLPSS